MSKNYKPSYKYLPREKIMQDLLDKHYDRPVEGTGVTFRLTNVSQRPMAHIMAGLDSLLQKYAEYDVKIYYKEDEDAQYLVLPQSAMVKDYSAITGLGFKIYHTSGVGMVQ